MTNIGLLLIVLAWAYQAWRLFKGDRNIQPIFAGLYAVGVLLLIIGSSVSGIPNFLSLDTVSFLIALLVLLLIVKKRSVR